MTFQPIVVCGAHMTGLPLNHQLTDLGAAFESLTATEAIYKFYALPGDIPRPGLIRVPSGGSSISVEIWQLPTQHFGEFLANIPDPLGLGTLFLQNNRQEIGFICEGIAQNGAEDISQLGSWRKYLEIISP